MLSVHNLRLQTRSLDRPICKLHLFLSSSFSSADSTTIDLLTFHQSFLGLLASKFRLNIDFASTRRCADIFDVDSSLGWVGGSYTSCIDQGCCSWPLSSEPLSYRFTGTSGMYIGWLHPRDMAYLLQRRISFCLAPQALSYWNHDSLQMIDDLCRQAPCRGLLAWSKCTHAACTPLCILAHK